MSVRTFIITVLCVLSLLATLYIKDAKENHDCIIAGASLFVALVSSGVQDIVTAIKKKN